VSDDQLVMAEREYQRCLAALHQARAQLSELEVALRRLAIDRSRLEPMLAAQQEAVLTSARIQAEALAADAHDRAEVARARLHHLTDFFDEPNVVSPAEPNEGFEQPPFGSGPGLGEAR
jgi:hypothetical protein